MACRISHCSSDIENYNICVVEQVAGFKNRSVNKEKGDMIYFVVKADKKTMCGARGVLDEITDYKPWPNADNYAQAWTLKEVEYCEPFELNILASIGGPHWVLRYVQGAKAIPDEKAMDLLNETFLKRKTPHFTTFEEYKIETLTTDDEDDEIELLDAPPTMDNKLDIMGTFQTIKFKNETDKIRGLEPLVNEHFFELFQHFSPDKTILIPENRLFKSVGKKNSKDENISGISGIPDALLISFDKNSKKTPIKINMIEYECYGESKFKPSQKFHYLNGEVIPQLMRFSSIFSVVTDSSIREKTIDNWVDKIIDYVNEDCVLTKKVGNWVKDLHPNIKERQIERYFEKELKEALRSNIRVILIIDELTVEQKETITNIIKSFKLDNSNSSNKDNFVEFSAYTIRLDEKINISNSNGHFALSFQQ